MSKSTRRTHALAILAATGMPASSYAPPLLHLLWRLGWDVPPPHFAPFFATALVSGGFFGLSWGGIMWLALWSWQGMPLGGALLASLAAGGLFGLGMAAYYAWGRRRHRLPAWSSLSAG